MHHVYLPKHSSFILPFHEMQLFNILLLNCGNASLRVFPLGLYTFECLDHVKHVIIFNLIYISIINVFVYNNKYFLSLQHNGQSFEKEVKHLFLTSECSFQPLEPMGYFSYGIRTWVVYVGRVQKLICQETTIFWPKTFISFGI